MIEFNFKNLFIIAVVALLSVHLYQHFRNNFVLHHPSDDTIE